MMETMKVRHKDHPTMTCAVCDESKNFYIGDPCNPETERFIGVRQAPYALLKGTWEPVPEARWVDVTAECEFDLKRGKLLHNRPNGTQLVVLGHGDTVLWEGYRLVKMMVNFPSGPNLLAHCGWAFIIEKQE